MSFRIEPQAQDAQDYFETPFFTPEQERALSRHEWRHRQRPSAAARRRDARQREQWEHELEDQADRAAMMHEYHPLTGRDEYDPHAYANDLFDVERERMREELGAWPAGRDFQEGWP